MADIRAFRGFRYDLGKVGSLSDVVAPPYDVIDAALQQQLYDKSPFNAVRIELTREEPGEQGVDKYLLSARTLNGWIADNVMRQDTARSLYVYEQEFTIEGKSHVRRGFLARVRLEPFGVGKIFPHEQTYSAPKEDRLKLYRETGFNISPIFGIYPDAENLVMAELEPLIRRAPPIVAVDHLGVINRLWVITDSATISKIIGFMGPNPVFIADGHHRYETGLKYLEEQREAGKVADDESPANFCLMMLVSMSEPGLVILPTHRLIHGIPDIDSAKLREILQDHFEIVGEFGSDAEACWEHIQLEDSQSVLGFGCAPDGKWFAAKLRDASIMNELVPEHSEEWRGLAVAILRKLVLDKLIPEKIGGTPTCSYVHLLREATDAIAAKSCVIAALVPPVALSDVETISENLEKMPQKSTYFYPKLLTGMVLNSLKKD